MTFRVGISLDILKSMFRLSTTQLELVQVRKPVDILTKILSCIFVFRRQTIKTIRHSWRQRVSLLCETDGESNKHDGRPRRALASPQTRGMHETVAVCGAAGGHAAQTVAVIIRPHQQLQQGNF